MALVLCAVLMLSAVAPATASTIYEKDGELVVEAGPGEANLIAGDQPPAGQPPTGYDQADHEHFWLRLSGGEVTTGAGCEPIEQGSPTEYHFYNYRCEAAGIGAVRLDAGDGGDSVGMRTDVPVTLLGGAGDDFWLEPPRHGLVDGGPGDDFFPYFTPGDAIIRGGPGRDRFEGDPEYLGFNAKEGLQISLDGVGNDGVPSDAHYNVMPDVEVVDGSEGGDTIVGSANADRLSGNLDNDTIDGGPGNDRIDAIDDYHESDPHLSPDDYMRRPMT
jgi:Ca2+-binding RTX toxin-like protein